MYIGQGRKAKELGSRIELSRKEKGYLDDEGDGEGEGAEGKEEGGGQVLSNHQPNFVLIVMMAEE